MEYSYYTVNFNRDKNDPVTEGEYTLVKADIEGFLIKVEDAIRDKQETLPPPNRIKWPLYFASIAVCGLVYLLGKYVIADPNMAGWLKGGGLIAGLICIGFPIIGVMRGNFDTKLHINVKIVEIDNYFKKHHALLVDTNNYQEYLKKLK